MKFPQLLGRSLTLPSALFSLTTLVGGPLLAQTATTPPSTPPGTPPAGVPAAPPAPPGATPEPAPAGATPPSAAVAPAAAPSAPPPAHPVAAPASRPIGQSPEAAIASAAASKAGDKEAPLEPPKMELSSGDGAHRLKLSAIVHADARLFFAESGVTTFAIRRARPSLDATLYRFFELKLQTDFAGSRAQLLDAYGNLHFIDEIQLTVGKGKGPIGLERLQSPRDITFAERAFPTLLVPNRDVGAKLHGKIADGSIEWALGVYNGVANGQSGDTDTNDAKDVEGRLFLLPFKGLGVEALEGLGLGVSGAIGNQQGPLAPYVTSGQQQFFSYAASATAFGKRRLVSPQGYFYGGPVGLMSEFVRVEEHIVSTNGASATVGSTAFQVAGSVVIGGTPSYKGVKVKTPFDPERGTFGALELKARYHSIRIGDLAYERGFASRNTAAALAQAFTVGGTLHFANGQRALIDYERTTFRGGAPNGGDRKPESVLVTRLQASF